MEGLESKNNNILLENSEKSLDQEIYNQKRNEIAVAYYKLVSRLNSIESKILEKQNKLIIIDDYIKNLKNATNTTDFDEGLFCALVDKIVVYKDKCIIRWKGEI